ncbi:hypothetical protein [Nostoc sp.]|uniref:hypothetical protein n=1 Tax=Nostoc sp. TaxID=1180 RepID=UPI002FFD0D6F
MLPRKRFVVAWNAELRSRCFSVKPLLTYWVITIPTRMARLLSVNPCYNWLVGVGCGELRRCIPQGATKI